MMMGFKMQIYPNEKQQEQLFEWCKASHNIWNFLVEKFNDKEVKMNRFGIENYGNCELLYDLGLDIPKRIASDVLKKYFVATKCYHKGQRNKPCFHKFNPNKQSFCLASAHWQVHNNFVYFLTVRGIGKNKQNVIYLDEHFIKKNNITEIREPHFTYNNGKWFLSASYIIPDVAKSQSKPMLGLDWGIKNFMTTSEGEFINYPTSVLREYQRIKKLQSIMDKKQYHSNNWWKIYHKFQKAYERFENLKYNFIQQKTTELAIRYNISVEKLSDNLIISKKFMRRQNMIAPRYKFIDIFKFKCDKFGSYFIEVNPVNTSKTCCVCGVIHNMNLKDRIMKCECGNIMDRDINAAINIKNEGERILSSMGVCCTQ